jgi:hypothetical protein
MWYSSYIFNFGKFNVSPFFFWKLIFAKWVKQVPKLDSGKPLSKSFLVIQFVLLYFTFYFLSWQLICWVGSVLNRLNCIHGIYPPPVLTINPFLRLMWSPCFKELARPISKASKWRPANSKTITLAFYRAYIEWILVVSSLNITSSTLLS